tara:strand:- start:3372 stop:4055 length:684 start_codon:yes stop_codon:yes gene_type:complete
MKLKKLHLFIILLLVLLFSSFGIKVLEGMSIIEGNSNISNSSQALANNKHRKTGEALTSADSGSAYNPFGNSQKAISNKDFKKARKIGPNVRVEFKKLGSEKKQMGYGSADGISRDQIPPGEEHLYVLKSEIVPPVCPKCPDVKSSSSEKGGGNCCKKQKCPPCPRPQRCPEPAFTCKKVPNYKASSVDNVLPSPMFEKNGPDAAPSGAGAGTGQPMARLSSFAKFS